MCPHWTTSGGTDCPSTPGAGYQQYFSSSGGAFGSALPAGVNVNAATGYYRYNLGSWHIIALNTAPCALSTPSFCAAGVIKLTLHNGSYDWQFLNDGETAFTDSGSTTCHSKPSA